MKGQIGKDVLIYLTDEQSEKLLPIRELLAESEEGRPRITIAQVYRDHFVVAVFDHETGLKLQEMTESPIGKVRT